MKPDALLKRLQSGQHSNVRFGDFVRLVERCGFHRQRVSGSHHAYVHPAARVLLSIQPERGEAKPYQIRQFLLMLDKYEIQLVDDVD